MYHENSKHKKGGIAVLTSDKTNFKTKILSEMKRDTS